MSTVTISLDDFDIMREKIKQLEHRESRLEEAIHQVLKISGDQLIKQVEDARTDRLMMDVRMGKIK